MVCDGYGHAWWSGLKAEGKVYNQFITVADARTPLLPGDYVLYVK